jgi:subtilisin-like proprotein convertase family protein/peroxiredoxin
MSKGKIFVLALTVALLIVVQTVRAYTPAPDFTMTGLDGKTFALSSFRGKVVLLEFFATWCPHCWTEASYLRTVKSNFGNSIAMISVSMDSSDWTPDNSKLLSFRNTYGITWTIAKDTGGAYNSKYNGKFCGYGIPQIYIIDQAGYIRFCHVSDTDSSTLIGEINRLIPPSTSYADIYIEHTYRGDLAVTIGVGDPSAPSWSQVVSNRQGGSADNLQVRVDLSGAGAFLPPSSSHRWYLKVYDAAAGDQGRIVTFTIAYQGQIYTSADVPVPVADFRTSYAYIPSRPVSTSYADIYIEHTYRGDLVITLGCGNPSSPLWSQVVSNRQGGSADNLQLRVDLSSATAYLPPSNTYRWFLKVYDAASGDQGRIVTFTITYQGTTYSSPTVPVPIYDGRTSYAYIPT